MLRTTCLTAAVAIAAPAFGQVAELTVQPGQSSASAQICLEPSGLGQRCDTDGSSISGMIDIELDDYDMPGAISIHDFDLALDGTLEYNMDWGSFIGGVDITLTGVTISYATPGIPTGPVVVDGAGDFEFPAVGAFTTGTGSFAGYGLVLEGLIGSGTFDLADFGAVESSLAGNIAVNGGQITLTGFQTFANSGEIEGVTATIDGSATIVAIGEVPPCPGDFNGDGTVNTQDVLAFLNAWTANDPSADCTDDGSINTQDVLCFLNAWTTGC
ncbi:MAG: GC-type dockerin domain-anchored protein [Planctomycetota bacterium]|nr:GC-type dockerin domain-anchored protein [Planctomycetota bacterium]